MPRAWNFPLTLLLVSTLVCALAPLVEAASVNAEPAKLDLALVGASAASVGGKTYIFGGRDSTDKYSDAIRMYDPVAKTLTTVAHFPTPAGGSTVGGSAGRYSGTAVTYGSKIYFFGGTQTQMIDINADGDPEPVPRALRDIFEFDPADNSLDLLSDKLPVGAWGMAGVNSGSAIYLFGGFSFDYSDLPHVGRHDWIIRFNPSSNEGSNQRVKELNTKLPYALQDAAAAILGRRVYIMGGLSDHNAQDNPCPTYTYYNPDTNQQQTAQIEVCITKRIVSVDVTFDAESAIGVAGELPYRSQFISAAVVNGKAYVSGALLADGSSSSSIIEVSVDRAGTPSTRVLTPALPTSMFGQAVATDGETIILAGGRTGGVHELSDQIIRLDPRSTVPWSPRSLVAAEIPGGGVRLTWEAPTYNGDAVITGYRLYRTQSGGTESRIAETTSLSYDDTGVKPGTEYSWRLTAVNSLGESTQSVRVSRSSGAATPGPVATFHAYPGNDQVVLAWLPPEETGGSNITSYRILRDGVLIASPPPDAIRYVDSNAKNGETYSYQIRAANSKGDGTLSEAARVTPAPVPSAPSSVNADVVAQGGASAVRLSWVAPTGSVDRYLVFRSTLPGRGGNLLANITETTFFDNLVERGRTYYYTIASENSVGRSAPSTESPVSLVRKPGAPGEVAAAGLDGEVRITWASPIDTGDAPESALRYYVSRQAEGSSRATIVRTDIEGNNYIDRAVTPGISYTYTVTTLNPMQSDPSAPAVATPKIIQNKAPEALLSILPPVTSAGDPVELDASQSSDLDGTLKSYLFDFGDGTDTVTTTDPTISHQYSLNGTFTATVIVTDNRNELSQPASAVVIVGETVNRNVDSGLPGRIPAGTQNAPGSKTGKVPGIDPGLILVGVAALALVLRGRHPRR